MKKRKMLILASFTLYLLSGGEVAFGQTQWVGTWVTAQQLTETNNNPPSPGLANNTLRQVIRVTLSGSQIRVLFSNQYGNSTLVMKEVHIASSSGGSTINISTDATLAFNGSDSVSIPAGQTVWSDTLSYSLTALSNYAISICFGDAPPDVTGHPGSRTTSYLQSGNAVTNASISGSTTDHWYILAGIDVVTDGTCAAVVTLGDSITDGRGSTTNGNDRWPDALANRLQADPNTNKVAVLNQGIGGNAVVSGGLGPTAVSRFDRDVIDQSGVKWCIVLEGVNDIGGSQSATNIINAYSQFIDKAHASNILIYGVPILPFGGSQYDSADHQATRQTVNDWIRTSGRFDAVIDLDAAVRDSSNPNRLASAYDSGDGLHLNPAGYQKMADSIPLSLLTPVEGTPLPTSVPAPAPTDVPLDCSNAPEWDASAVYENAGTRVVYNGNLYENNWYSSGQNPEENSGEYDVWTLIGPCDSQTTLVPTTVPTATPVETPVPTAQTGNIGDVNSDGAIDIVDALLVAQYYVGLNPQNFNAGNADANCNGTIDIVDALLVAQYYVGLISRFC